MYSVVLAAMLTTGATTPNWGYGCRGCAGCYGYYNAFTPQVMVYNVGCYGCSGCWGCSGCYGYYVYPVYPVYYYPVYGCYSCRGAAMGHHGHHKHKKDAHKEKGKKDKKDKKKKKDADADDDGSAQAAPGQVIVHLPKGAQLFINQIAMHSGAGKMTFHTATLQPGRKYTYTVQVQVKRDGENISQTKKVSLVAGAKVTVKFSEENMVETAEQ